MINIHQKFCKETFYSGSLIDFEPIYEESFNFAYDVIDAIALATPTRRAMVWCNDKGEEHTFTFSDISKYSNMAANMFLSLGVKRGDKVMLVLKRHYQFWFAVLGLHKIGAIAVPAVNQLTKKDFLYRFKTAEIQALICTVDGDVISNAEEAISEYSNLKFIMSVNGKIKGWRCFDEDIKKYSCKINRHGTKCTDPMLLYFTSGTTGMPKMVCHDFTYPLGHIVTAKYWQSVVPDGLHLTISDTGWLKSMWGKLYGQWFMEAGIFVCDFDRFNPANLLPLFSKYQITTFCAPPTMFRLFIKENIQKYDLSSLKHVTIAGEALNPEIFKRFYEATGIKPMEGFGQSETTAILFNSVGTEPKPGSMGKPSPAYDVDIIDRNGNSVDPGEIGEIVIRTDKGKPCGMFNGYYNDKKKTNYAWNNNIYHTGDTAWKDEDGYVWYVGRTDDIIKSSGYRIGPFEIESVLLEHPSVLECAVTGVPDKIRGQIVKAAIVLSHGFKPSESLKKEIQNFVKHQTAPYKYPRAIDFVDAIPKTATGKIIRSAIR